MSDRLALPFLRGDVAVPGSGPILYIDAAPGPVLDLLPRDRTACLQPWKPLADALTAAGFPPVDTAPAGASLALVLLGRNRARNLGRLALALDRLAPGARLVAAGAKTDGVEPILKALRSVLPELTAEAKDHGKVIWAVRPARPPAALGAALASWTAAATPAPNRTGMVAGPGMFSADDADPGSARLAAHLPGALSGRVIELGAGWGWLAAQALDRCPAIETLTLVEADAEALAAARRNVSDPRARFLWADATALAPERPGADWVLSNPPFHPGRRADPDLGRGFILAAARLLAPGGRFLMVANRHLPYEPALAAAFRQCERLEEAGGYKIYRATGPVRPR